MKKIEWKLVSPTLLYFLSLFILVLLSVRIFFFFSISLKRLIKYKNNNMFVTDTLFSRLLFIKTENSNIDSSFEVSFSVASWPYDGTTAHLYWNRFRKAKSGVNTEIGKKKLRRILFWVSSGKKETHFIVWFFLFSWGIINAE